MSFNYDKASAKENDHGSWWTSYADLFMMLSIVFLLMYVASSLRNGSAGFQQVMENKKLAKKAEDLEQQIRVYNTLKDESLRTETSESEQDTYSKLMDKLTLLQDEARGEKQALEKKARENGEKEFALNQYQQLIRNIINANVLAKSQIHRRDKIIVVKDATIEEKKQKISEMEQVVAKNEAQIETINSQLDNNIKALRNEQLNSMMSKHDLEQKIFKLRQESATKVRDITQKNNMISQELGQVKGTLQITETKLAVTETKLGDAHVAIQKKEQEKNALYNQLQRDKVKYADELTALQEAHAAKMAAEKTAFDEGLRKQRLSAEARAKKIAAYAEAAKRKQAELEGSLNGLKGKIADTEEQLKGTQQALAGTEQKLAGTQEKLMGTQEKLAGTVAKLQGTQQALQGTTAQLAGAEADKGRALAAVEDLKGDLAKTKAIANARKQLAQLIGNNFAKSGIKGAVDGKTGEVTLDFGEEYFDTGSTSLKPKMRVTLDKFIPVYAKSLFDDPKIADKIGNVEIIGFASSTFKGKYVNPKSIRPEDKAAIEYNLKLSFGRANSIFSHMLNQQKLSKADREKLLPLMKVVGRGYLPDNTNASEIPDNLPEGEFCKRFNCNKAQRVIVKFNMKD